MLKKLAVAIAVSALACATSASVALAKHTKQVTTPAQAQAILAIIARVDAGELTPDAARSAVKIALDALPAPPEGSPKPGRI